MADVNINPKPAPAGRGKMPFRVLSFLYNNSQRSQLILLKLSSKLETVTILLTKFKLKKILVREQ